MFKGKQKPTSTQPPKTLLSLPPDLILHIFEYLPVPDIPQVACSSRRLKVLVYNDQVYDPKLRALNMLDALKFKVDASSTSTKDALSARLRTLPNGHLLPGSSNYLESGSLWSNVDSSQTIARDSDTTTGTTTTTNAVATVGTTEEKAKEQTPTPLQIQTDLQKISSILPNPNITIGAGGLKAFNRKKDGIALGKRKDVLPVTKLAGRSSREVFKQVYLELYPYYVDFRVGQKDSKVFRDYQDAVEIAAILHRLYLFSKAKFIPGCEDIHFALETTIEWFESTILGNFEEAYDKQNVLEMRKNALAAFQLNGGQGAVNVFIAKNPIFFDHTFNPSLIASKLPTVGGPAVGYALADDFAKYMDHMLNNCKKQSELVSSVFVPDVDALTLFVNKVFEDSIAEYLTAVLKAAKQRENLGIYLHTLATSVYCCTQFVEFIANNPEKVSVNVEKIRESIAVIFRPYTLDYMDKEVEHMKKRFDKELDKFQSKRKELKNKQHEGSAVLTDRDKMQQHKRMVMDTMKTIMFAPMVLTKTLVMNGFNLNKQAQPLMEDAESMTPSPVQKMDAVTYNIDDNSLGSLVSLELCLNLMHGNKEALGRALVITSATDDSQLCINVQKIFCPILKSIGERHIKTAFVAAVDRLAKSVPLDSKKEEKLVNMDSLQFFELVHIADLVQQMLDVYYNEDIKAWIDETDFLSDIVCDRKAFERLLDDSVASGMDKAIQVLVNQVEYILLVEQQLTDYNPPETAAVLDVKPTQACSSVIKCINTHIELLQGVAEKHTLEVFFSEVGVRLFNVICKNLKRLQISQTGSFQLICDFNRYCEWAGSLRVSSVSKLFQVLKELGSLYLADGGEELRKQVHDLPRFQGVLRIEEIYELMASRTDYKKIQKYVETKECIIQ